MSVCGITPAFAGLSPFERPVRYVFLTRLPCYCRPCERPRIRLACIKHAASVRSEPGSNSPLDPFFAQAHVSSDTHACLLLPLSVSETRVASSLKEQYSLSKTKHLLFLSNAFSLNFAFFVATILTTKFFHLTTSTFSKKVDVLSSIFLQTN